MRRPSFWLAILLGGSSALVSVCFAQVSENVAQAPQPVFAVSFMPGSRDDAGRFMGGTEMRVLAAHAGRLYAGNGYWEDQPGPEGLQGAQILVLNGPGAQWRVDHGFDERMADGRPRDLAVSTLEEVTFATDGNGVHLPAPVSLLIVANWDLTGTARVFSRDDATGAWTAASLAQGRPMPGFLPQVRSLGGHRDLVTGIDRVFAGASNAACGFPALRSRTRLHAFVHGTSGTRMASSGAPTTRPSPAISVGAPPRSLNSRVSRRRDYQVAAVILGSAALPNATAASTRRWGSTSTSGSMGQTRIGTSSTPMRIPAIPRPGCVD
jgi:hypothetical protein